MGGLLRQNRVLFRGPVRLYRELPFMAWYSFVPRSFALASGDRAKSLNKWIVAFGNYSPVVRGGIYSLVSVQVVAGQRVPAPVGIRPEKSASRRLSRCVAVFRRGKGVSQAESGRGSRKGCYLLLSYMSAGSTTAHLQNGIASEADPKNGGAKGRGRPCGGKFMPRRRPWKRRSERSSDRLSGNVDPCVLDGQLERHGSGMLYRLRWTEVRVKT